MVPMCPSHPGTHRLASGVWRGEGEVKERPGRVTAGQVLTGGWSQKENVLSIGLLFFCGIENSSFAQSALTKIHGKMARGCPLYTILGGMPH